MKNLTAFMEKIADVIKKDVDIVDRAGYVRYTSNPSRQGLMIEGYVPGSHVLDSKKDMYIHIDGGSCEETDLVNMMLKDRINEGTADNYQQFLINILDGCLSDNGEDGRFGIFFDKSFIAYCIGFIGREHFNDGYSLILNSFYDQKGVWVFPYRGEIILVEERENFSQDVKTVADTIKDMVNCEVFTDILIGVGNIHKGADGIKKSFEEAREAINIGRMFSLPGNIYIYKDILSERLISMIPHEKAEKLLEEFAGDGFDEVLDSEMVKTIDVLFKNDLNISDSARILYIHRNTLLYRLDKIEKATGFDIRKFEDAAAFRLIYLLRQERKR